MALDLEKLQKILSIEAQDAFQNRKVYRGLSAFVTNWTQTALRTNLKPDEARLVEQVSNYLTDYSEYDLTQRQQAIETILKLLPQSVATNKTNAAPPKNSVVQSSEATTTSKIVASPASASEKNLKPSPTRINKQPQDQINISDEQVDPWNNSTKDSHYLKNLPTTNTLSSNAATGTKSKTAKSTSLDVYAPLTTVKGVGPQFAQLLDLVGLHTIHDALYYFPFRHEDFSSFKKINQLMFNMVESVMVQVLDVASVRTRSAKEIIEVVVQDETGTLKAVFFNRKMTYGLKPGQRVVMSGRVEQWGGSICLKSPTFEPADKELLNTGRLVPVYHLVGPVKEHTLRRIIKSCVDGYAKALPEHLPAIIKQRNQLIELSPAVANYHFPTDKVSLERARRRLAFDEFFLIQLGVLMKRHEWQEERPALPLRTDPALLEEWRRSLPFDWTGAQKRAIYDILGDINKAKPMSRLLQGDVGSGKTVVGATALLMAVANGFQGALMAPTEILAGQHFRGLSRLFENFCKTPAALERNLTIRVAALTGSTKPKDKQRIKQEIAEGKIDIVIGTHAVIQEGVDFARMGLVIIDEQHRFGVQQRATLRQKGVESNPHLLVMTATPIPRSLALTIYGDLDLSIIDEMPPGRQVIKTKWVMPMDRQKSYNFIRKQVKEGRQAFVICPLVEESEKIEAKAAVEEHAHLQQEVFPDLKLGLLHGKMKPALKDEIMSEFRDRKFDILVSTSVIEVGIDIPNATVIMIEGAERFGLAQLHQFRGRVGRGEHQSYCLLLAGEQLSEQGQQRLKIIEDSQDGFVLAEADLKLRGPGEFFGTRQSGVPDLRVAGVHDTPLLELARREANSLFENDPGLTLPEHAHISQKVAKLWNVEGDLS
jgi:ATP-dependent DNA helicase RecG